jgi:hypothetical protein
MIERQEIHCHDCNKYVHFDMDTSINGNHVLKCPNCEHEHCRVVKDGKITDIRWDTRNGPTMWISSSTISYSDSSIYYNTASWTSSGTSDTSYFIARSWLNTVSTS